jgi:hypothetical protein
MHKHRQEVKKCVPVVGKKSIVLSSPVNVWRWITTGVAFKLDTLTFGGYNRPERKLI